MNPDGQPLQLQMKASDDDLKGRFSNFANVNRLNDHYYIDFFMATTNPPMGVLLSRIAMTPGHLISLRNAINDQVKQYEKATGKKVEPADEGHSFGFRTP